MITILRIVGAMFLLIIKPLSVLFFIIYAISGLSDILDGYLARKYNVTSQLGARLDSIADFVLITVMLIVFIPIIAWETWIVVWINIIILVRFSTLLIGYKKYHDLAFLHTYANKATGFSLFLFPFFYSISGLEISIFVLCCLASISAVEELILTLKCKVLDKNIKGIFLK